MAKTITLNGRVYTKRDIKFSDARKMSENGFDMLSVAKEDMSYLVYGVIPFVAWLAKCDIDEACSLVDDYCENGDIADLIAFMTETISESSFFTMATKREQSKKKNA